MTGMPENETGMPGIRTRVPRNNGGCMLDHDRLLVAKIPIAKFEDRKLQGVLSDRLFHQCMDVIVWPLKKCSKFPDQLTDANGKI